MAAPTSVAANEVAVTGGSGTGTTLDTNLASRQVVEIYNNGAEDITIVESTGSAPTITPGTTPGIILAPGNGMAFWAGPGIRFYARARTTTQSAGAGTYVVESA